MNAVNDLFGQLGDLSPAAFAGLILLIINFMLRRFPFVPNKWIPISSIIAGTILFPIFVPTATNIHNPIARNIGEGFIVGFGAWLLYDKIVALAEKRWPWLSTIINGPDTTGNKPSTPSAAAGDKKDG